MSLCPCGSGLELAACCEPIVHGAKSAPTAEALMRARYTAHALREFVFLETSLHSSTRESVDSKKLNQLADVVAWTGMEIHGTEGGGADDTTGRVSFTAKYSVNGVEQTMREDASFVREEGEWRYLEGLVEGHTTYHRDSPKIGRNDLCPCGSGKKYKKCCGGK
ncbi:hypothetical protein FACS1894206_00910 [Deltaproteobacteria bacterium]|nr:hypothetical protein FACS1894206_00910 [Deltaproteobacteria bacterium]